jgi:hypothetical protein
MSQPRVQAVVYHPKVQWVIARLRIRRWLTIRRWPPLFLASTYTRMLTDPMHGPRWEQNLTASAVGISTIVIALSVDAYLTRRARRLVGVRPRPVYLAMAAGPVALAVICMYVAGPLNAHHPRLSDLVALAGGLSGWTALLALGRALTWGHFRRLCWIYPPANRPPADKRDVS